MHAWPIVLSGRDKHLAARTLEQRDALRTALYEFLDARLGDVGTMSA